MAADDGFETYWKKYRKGRNFSSAEGYLRMDEAEPHARAAWKARGEQDEELEDRADRLIELQRTSDAKLAEILNGINSFWAYTARDIASIRDACILTIIRYEEKDR